MKQLVQVRWQAGVERSHTQIPFYKADLHISFFLHTASNFCLLQAVLHKSQRCSYSYSYSYSYQQP